ncbi:dimethylglycine dehydrogenase [Burkholderia vietnamiensis]|uniref:DJ-1/PfpI family protein n=1 Tax=Burkholderia vietnamiensis TaxID=60552 RepID=UPI00075DACE8|nr:DJ-1/PfpI family protein [Burkholderia vietnamiensis]KVF21707.1 dimethylglycine dehydrogenase [Burkholderia vietnamiensis]KVG06771.1 dimethylglycine dehydrogenase [Burkholderia vietnamiensis]MBR8356913.1 DJ-1/PfpI family protein [Burkholderia vietnamiensis]HDR9200453.1 DJ-1/PfpI family protein [Burkholderia vietnamiensis]HDR9358286.1 DJ-1/PfpI family protein [Burkholderia vietnamiensis]
MTLHIGLLVFPGVQQLDLTGPHDVLASLPDAAVHLVWKSRDTVASSSGLALAPTCTFDDCPPLDVICVPGGIGINELLLDAQTIAFVQQRAATARYVTSVCTGALLLGVAGLLKSRRATTHWAFHSLLEPLGAVPVRERVVRDGNLITGGGVTAGIDFALTIAAELAGVEEAQSIQLALEYAPAPPFDAGSPDTAPASVLERVTQRSAAGLEKRRQTIDAALRAMAR